MAPPRPAASAVLVALCAVPCVVLVPPPAAAIEDGGDRGGYVGMASADPDGMVDPPLVELRVGTPARTVGPAARAAGPRRAARCRFTPEPAWEKAIRALPGSIPAPGHARTAGRDRVDQQARLFSRVCDGAVAGLVWLHPTTRAGGGALAVLARVAFRRLRLGFPVVRMSPATGARQLVRVPTWLWIDRRYWRARRAVVSVPGLAARATAVPVSARWAMGDGATVTCRGAGSPFRSGVDDPSVSSPDCGHTYTSTGRMPVTVTVTWRVAWAGGGTRGVLPPLTATSQVRVRVVESQAVNQYQPGAGR